MRLISLGLGVDLGFQFRMSSSSQHSSRTWPRFEAVVCDHGLEADVGCLKLDRDNMQRALRDRVAKQDALDESVRSKTIEVEALQGVVAHLANITSDLVVA
ncbi:hypothetical protein SASPL_141219 [Salvia splendens]|uniref:Uncharacterized protein n=1 Tax=Salvia splendens TaxID=180675 RepID=A0A8X8WT76_SALSN|nr:hypothetical protein SASPL_141219 [Salvia splendens]